LRSKLAPLLLGGGAFLLTLALLVALVAKPALLKAPLVNSSTTQATSPALRLDSTTGQQVAGEFQQTRSVGSHTVDQGGKKVAQGNGDTAVYDDYTSSNFVAAGGATSTLSKGLSTTAFDRSTGAGQPGRFADTTATTGNVFKLPFGTEKKTYSWYDGQAKQAFPLEFVRETQVEGVDAYEFRQVVPPTDLGPLPVVGALPGSLLGEPETPSIPANQWVEDTDKRVVIEPVTGQQIAGVSHTHIWAQTADGRKVDVLTLQNATSTPESERSTVASVKESKSKAQLLGRLPWVLGLLGLLLLLAGLLLLRRRASDRRTTGDGSTVVDDDSAYPAGDTAVRRGGSARIPTSRDTVGGTPAAVAQPAGGIDGLMQQDRPAAQGRSRLWRSERRH